MLTWKTNRNLQNRLNSCSGFYLNIIQKKFHKIASYQSSILQIDPGKFQAYLSAVSTYFTSHKNSPHFSHNTFMQSQIKYYNARVHKFWYGITSCLVPYFRIRLKKSPEEPLKSASSCTSGILLVFTETARDTVTRRGKLSSFSRLSNATSAL